MGTMRAARLHRFGTEFSIDDIERPVPRSRDVVVDVRACGLVPNMKNVMSVWAERHPYLPLPPLPAVFGLDAAGVVSAVGDQVDAIEVGQRVYINPGIGCGSCHACRHGEPINCDAYAFLGYFGFGERSRQIYRDYPLAGFAQCMTAPAAAVVKLPDAVSFEEGARFGYLGTAFSGLRKGGAGAGRTVLINGATGTLGLGAVLLALAMGCTRVFALGRNRALLERIEAIDPRRVTALAAGDRPVDEWIREHTLGLGVDIFLDAIGPGTTAKVSLQGFDALRRGGRMVVVGALSDPFPVDMVRIACAQTSIIGSLWFDVAEGEAMAAMCAAGTLDLSVLSHQRFGLAQINSALDAIERREGGFTNVVIVQDGEAAWAA